MTSMTLSNPILELHSSILGLFGNLSAGWVKWSKRRSFEPTLDGLSDRQLSDIGLKIGSGTPSAVQGVRAA